MSEQSEKSEQNPLNDPEPPQPPAWAAEEWKPGRWIVSKGQGIFRQVHGPTFGNSAEIFDSEEAAQAVAEELNAAEEENDDAS